MGHPELIARSTPQHLSLVGGEPEVVHVLQHAAALQRAIEGFGDADLLRDAASAVAHAQLQAACGEADGVEERLALAASHHRRSGLGLVDLRGLGRDGGAVALEGGHAALDLAGPAAPREAPTCRLTAGWLAGVASAAFDRPLGAYEATETRCAALAGGARCELYVSPLRRPRALRPSVGAGGLPAALPARGAAPSRIDEPAVLAALAAPPLEGDADGRLSAFGLRLARHPANALARASQELVRRLEAERPDRAAAAEEALVEAARAGALHLLGGLLASPAWRTLIEPRCEGPADRAAGLVACVNALGWGRWTVLEVARDERVVVGVDAGFEANHHLAAYGATSTRGRCALGRGGVAALLGLLGAGDAAAAPGAIRAEETRCRTRGDERCELVAARASRR